MRTQEYKNVNSKGYLRRLIGYYLEEHDYAIQRAKKLDLSFSEYIRHLINEDKKKNPM